MKLFTLEQRLFKHILVLAFFMGLIFGLWGLLIGMKVYNFIQSGFNLWGPFTFNWPLDAFQVILNGVLIVLFLKILNLWSQFITPSPWKANHITFVRFWEYLLRIFGLLLIGAGLVSLLEKPLSFLYPKQELEVDVFLILLMLFYIGGFSWYLFVRGKRRSGQQIAREEAVKDPTM